MVKLFFLLDPPNDDRPYRTAGHVVGSPSSLSPSCRRRNGDEARKKWSAMRISSPFFLVSRWYSLSDAHTRTRKENKRRPKRCPYFLPFSSPCPPNGPMRGLENRGSAEGLSYSSPFSRPPSRMDEEGRVTDDRGRDFSLKPRLVRTSRNGGHRLKGGSSALPLFLRCSI